MQVGMRFSVPNSRATASAPSASPKLVGVRGLPSLKHHAPAFREIAELRRRFVGCACSTTDEGESSVSTVNDAVEETQPEVAESESEPKEVVELDASFVPGMKLSELPKGYRKEVVVDGKDILIFWYRNEIWAVESRSPAEGAYSEGFMSSFFTENYGIQCPGTSSVFSIKTGEILEWYPTNPVLRALIPQDTCRKLEVYPVQVANDTIYVSFKGGSLGGVQSMRDRGGAASSLEGNNVFYSEPKMYIEGTEPGQDAPAAGSKEELRKLNPVTVLVGTVAVAIVSVAGTGLAVYNESVVQLIGFWVVMLGVVGGYVLRFMDMSDEKKD